MDQKKGGREGGREGGRGVEVIRHTQERELKNGGREGGREGGVVCLAWWWW
jgi:hypothetical protein